MYNSDSNRPAGSSSYDGSYAPPRDLPVAPAPPPTSYGSSPVYSQTPTVPVYPVIPGNAMPYYYTAPYPAPANQGQGKAIASLVLGIVCIVFSINFFLGLPCAVIGLVLGILARRQRAGGMATAGIVLSCIGLVFSLMIVALFLIGFYLTMQEVPYIQSYDSPHQQAFLILGRFLK